jgi:ribosome maturation factor RimP
MKRAPAKPVKLTPDQIREIETAVFQLVEAHLDARFYLLDVNFEKEAGYWYLRIYVEGRDFLISLNDCEAVSRALDPLLDEFSPLRELSYSLEVSSPGLFRPLRQEREFAFYAGRPVRVESKPPQKGKPVQESLSKPEEGILKSFDAARNVVTLKRPENNETFEVALDEEKMVCLNPEVHFPGDDGPDAPSSAGFGAEP